MPLGKVRRDLPKTDPPTSRDRADEKWKRPLSMGIVNYEV